MFTRFAMGETPDKAMLQGAVMGETKEIWADCKGYEGLYQVSSLGRVGSLLRVVASGDASKCFQGRLLSPWIEATGYFRVSLCKEGADRKRFVHQLVAAHFLPAPDEMICVNHLDGNKLNNVVSNLEWCTHSENRQHAVDVLWVGRKPVIAERDGVGFWFPSSKSGAGHMGVPRESISMCLSGKQKTTGGFFWRQAPFLGLDNLKI